MKNIYLIKIIILLFCTYSSAQITVVSFSTGFSAPIDLTNAGDKRIFVVEQAGKIFIVDSAGVKKTTPFLNIQTRVLSGGERGLLGLAFPPDYASTGKFYVNYTRQTDGRTRISRFTVSSTNPDSAVENSEEILLTIYQPFSNHNGGNLKFGPDGYLYIGMGDGGSGGDPGNRSQNLDSLLGKMLRIDVRCAGPTYSNPPSNPFVGIAGKDEIWASGLRNPWRWSFDRWNGDLWIGDVGQNLYEEVDYQPASSPGGENYGWRCYEGNHAFNTAGCGVASNYDLPVLEIAHSTGACSVIGGYVYRGAEYSNMFGTYFLSDQCNSNIRTIIKNPNGTFTNANLGTLGGNTIVSFGEDKWGELYLVTYGGTIYKFKGANCSPVAFLSDTDTVHVCTGGMYMLHTPAGNGFSYSWKLNGNTIAGANESSYPAVQTGNYTVTVTNRTSCTSTSSSVHLAFDIINAPVNGGCAITLNLKIFIEAFYLGNSQMEGALFESGLDCNSKVCDSITVELREPNSPYNIALSISSLVNKDGTSTILFPLYVLNQSYYLVVRHRNSVGTWSKVPLLIDNHIMNFDFTKP